jgi:hypothetical protein
MVPPYKGGSDAIAVVKGDVCCIFNQVNRCSASGAAAGAPARRDDEGARQRGAGGADHRQPACRDTRATRGSACSARAAGSAYRAAINGAVKAALESLAVRQRSSSWAIRRATRRRAVPRDDQGGPSEVAAVVKASGATID